MLRLFPCIRKLIHIYIHKTIETVEIVHQNYASAYSIRRVCCVCVSTKRNSLALLTLSSHICTVLCAWKTLSTTEIGNNFYYLRYICCLPLYGAKLPANWRATALHSKMQDETALEVTKQNVCKWIIIVFVVLCVCVLYIS